jgi:hypothetical protein
MPLRENYHLAAHALGRIDLVLSDLPQYSNLRFKPTGNLMAMAHVPIGGPHNAFVRVEVKSWRAGITADDHDLAYVLTELLKDEGLTHMPYWGRERPKEEASVSQVAIRPANLSNHEMFSLTTRILRRAAELGVDVGLPSDPEEMFNV